MPPPQYNPTDMIPREAGGASGTSNTSSSGEPPAYASISEHTPTSKSSPAQQQQQSAAPPVSSPSSSSLPLKSESSRTMVSSRARHESDTQKSKIIESSVVESSIENDEIHLATGEIVSDQEASKDSLDVVHVDCVDEISRRDEKN